MIPQLPILTLLGDTAQPIQGPGDLYIENPRQRPNVNCKYGLKIHRGEIIYASFEDLTSPEWGVLNARISLTPASAISPE